MLRGLRLNATEPKQRATGTRLALLIVVLLLAAVGTVYAQNGPGTDPGTGPNPGNGPAPAATPANPGQPGTAGSLEADARAIQQQASDVVEQASGPIKLSENPFYRVEQLFKFSPVINGIILGLSVLGLLFFITFMLTINRRTMVPHGFVDEVVKLVIRGDYERAGDVCRRARGVFAADIIQRCIENHNQQHSVMLDMIDTEGRRLADIIWNRVSYLADISNIAPMLGLLGTVLGMIKAFYGLQQETGTIDALTLSRGVGEAMSTTLFGLSVGIVMTVLYSVVKSRATRTLAEAEAAVHRIADHIKRDDTAIPSSR